VDTERLQVIVSKSLFTGEGVSAKSLGAWLRNLPGREGYKTQYLTERQCVAGALMLLLAYLRPEPSAPAGVRKLLENVLRRPSDLAVLGALPEALAEIGWISPGDDSLVCAAALEVLVEMSGPEPPVPSEALTKIRGLLRRRRLADTRLIMAYLDRILAISRGDVEFTQFREHGGLRAAKGLLLFLLRPDPAAVGTWPDEDINAEAQVTALAAIFAGIAHRLEGLSTELRGSDVLQHCLLDWIAVGVNGSDIGLPHSTTPAVGLERQGRDLVLTIDSKPAGHWTDAAHPD
jgi:hypothetical protein